MADKICPYNHSHNRQISHEHLFRIKQCIRLCRGKQRLVRTIMTKKGSESIRDFVIYINIYSGMQLGPKGIDRVLTDKREISEVSPVEASAEE